MPLILLLLLYTVPISANANDIIGKLRHELKLSKTVDYDPVIPFLCTVLPSIELKTTSDQYLIHSILNELGFRIVGMRQGSWASKYQANPYRRPSCTPAIQSIATSETSKISTVDLKKLIRRSCLPTMICNCRSS